MGRLAKKPGEKGDLLNFYGNPGTVKRADAILKKRNHAGWGLTRSHVLRMALHMGMEKLEKEVGAKG